MTEAMHRQTATAEWWRGIHFIAAAGLGLRVLLVLVSDRIHQADEIFQYLEQGHRVAFGYGYVPWEYRFGTRSWLIPGFVAAWLFVFKALHLDDPAIYVTFIRLLSCVLSVALIYSAYVIARNIASETAGRLAAIFTATWWELIYFAHKPTPEVLGSYLVMGALACAVVGARDRRPILLGLLAGLTVTLRFQYLPAIVVLGLFVGVAWRRGESVKVGAAALLAVGAAGYVDRVTWGGFFASYYNNYLFNTVYRVSEIFGTEPLYFYPAALSVSSAGIFAVTGLMSLATPRKTFLLVACAASIVLAHSAIPHKEYRFIVVVVPLLLVLTAAVLSDGVSRYIGASRRTLVYAAAIVVFLSVSLIGLMGHLPRQERVYEGAPLSKQEILAAYTHLYRDPDLVAVLNAVSTWPGTGGYYYLHRNVPIYFPPDLASKAIAADDVAAVVSHVVCRVGADDIPGFTTVHRMKTLEIRKQTNPPARYRDLGINTMEVFQRGVDDREWPGHSSRPLAR